MLLEYQTLAYVVGQQSCDKIWVTRWGSSSGGIEERGEGIVAWREDGDVGCASQSCKETRLGREQCCKELGGAVEFAEG